MAISKQYVVEYVDDILWLLADLEYRLDGEVSSHGKCFLRILLAKSGLIVAFKYLTESRNESGLSYLTNLMLMPDSYAQYYSKLEASYKDYYTKHDITPRFDNLREFLYEISGIISTPYYLIDESDFDFTFYRELFDENFCKQAHSSLIDCYNLINGNLP